MYRFFSAAVCVAAMAITQCALADTLQVYNVANATFASGATGSGTITVDETTGTYAGLNFTYRLGASTAVFTSISGQGPYLNQYYFYSYDSVGDLLDLGVAGANSSGTQAATSVPRRMTAAPVTDTSRCQASRWISRTREAWLRPHPSPPVRSIWRQAC